MALSRDLLAQARLLVDKEPKRPKQASLRRAISSSYYALFHLLVDQSCRFVVSGNSVERRALREQLARSYDHGAMKNASRTFAGAGLNPWLAVGTPPPAELVRVAESFVVLQEQRHEADYNVGRSFTRNETLALIAQAEDAFKSREGVKGSSAADAYLIALLIRARG